MRISKKIQYLHMLIVFFLTVSVLSAYRSGRAINDSDILLPSAVANVMDTEEHISNTIEAGLHTIETELPYRSSLSSVLISSGLGVNEALDISNSMASLLDLRRIHAGQKVEIDFAHNDIPIEIRIPIRYDHTVATVHTPHGWEAENRFIDMHPVVMKKKAVIESSLFTAAQNSSIPISIMMDAIDLFSFEVDFQRDIHPGDTVELIYTMLTDTNNEVRATGDILFARLSIGKHSIDAWRYEQIVGKSDYYDHDGDSIRKALLKTPVESARITSGFGIRRHPVLGYTSHHRGVDFAVPIGTPVKASGDGTVTITGWHDQYGYRIKIRHANHYDTLYAHLSQINVRTGTRVEQGDIIGLSGNTGMSTGPHCHYEVHYYGSPVDSRKLKFPPGHTLTDEDLRLFELHRQAMIKDLKIETDVAPDWIH